MPRALRIEYPGAVYHVMNRGNHRQHIVRDEMDRRRFLATLGEACAKTGWQIHAWCLMRHHFHLVCQLCVAFAFAARNNCIAGLCLGKTHLANSN